MGDVDTDPGETARRPRFTDDSSGACTDCLRLRELRRLDERGPGSCCAAGAGALSRPPPTTVGAVGLSNSASVGGAMGDDANGVIESPRREGETIGDPSGLGTTETGGEGLMVDSGRISVADANAVEEVAGPAAVAGVDVDTNGEGGGKGASSEARRGGVAGEEDSVPVGTRSPEVLLPSADASREHAALKLIPSSPNSSSLRGVLCPGAVSARCLHSSGAVRDTVS